MAQIHWAAAVSGAFNTAADWTGGAVPGAGDDAILDPAGIAYTVTDNTSQSVNSIQTAANATLDIDNAFTATNGTGTGANAGTITLGAGGAFLVSGVVDNSGTIDGYSTAVPAQFGVTGNTTLTGGGLIANISEVTAASGATLTNVNDTIANCAILAALVNDAAGTIIGGSVTAVVNQGVLDGMTLNGTASQTTNSGVIENCQIHAITNSGVIAGGTIGVQNAPQTAVVLNNTGVLINTAIYDSFNNSGLLEIAAGAAFSFYNLTINDVTGGVLLANNGVLDLADGNVIGGVMETLNGGTLLIDGSIASQTLTGSTYIAGGSTGVELLGTVINLGNLRLLTGATDTILQIGATPVYLTGRGGVILGASNSDIITGLAPGASLTNVDNIISGAGLLGDGALTLVNQIDGAIVGDDNTALIIDTGSTTIVNGGEIGNTGIGGTVVNSPVNSAGYFIVDGGTLTLNGAVTGSGTGDVCAGTLYAASTFNQDVQFTPIGTLELAHSQSYSGTIYEFSTTGQTALDLNDIAFGASTAASYSGTNVSGVLTVTDGTHIANINFMGDYTNSIFTVSSDGHGGTMVVDPTKTKTAATFVAAMAAFGAGGTSSAAAEPWRSAPTTLARPGVHPA